MNIFNAIVEVIESHPIISYYVLAAIFILILSKIVIYLWLLGKKLRKYGAVNSNLSQEKLGYTTQWGASLLTIFMVVITAHGVWLSADGISASISGKYLQTSVIGASVPEPGSFQPTTPIVATKPALDSYRATDEYCDTIFDQALRDIQVNRPFVRLDTNETREEFYIRWFPWVRSINSDAYKITINIDNRCTERASIRASIEEG